MLSSLKIMARRMVLARQLKDADSERREAAVEELADLGDAGVVDLIVSALKDQEPSVRKAAAKALGRIGDNKAVEPLIECLTDPKLPGGAWQAEILLALESLKDPRSMGACAQALTSSHVKVRRAAASALGNLDQPSAVPALIAAMKDEDDEVVRRAGYALTKVGRAAVAPLIQMLKNESGRTQQAAAEALGVIGDPQTIDALVEALRGKDSFLQIVAAKALSRIEDPRVIAPLVQALDESSTAAFFYGVREEAEFALAKMGRRAVEPFLAALRDPSARGRIIIAKLLAQIPDPRIFDALVETLKDPNIELRKAALNSLMTLNAQKAKPVLQSLLSDSNCQMRRTAAELLVKSGWEPATPLERARLAIGLGKFGEAMSHGNEAVELVLGRAQDEDAGIRRDVFKALGHSHNPRFIDTLAAAAAIECEPDVQRTIIESLAGIGNGATDALVQLLETGDWRKRRFAAKSLQALGWEPANPSQQVLLALCTGDPEGAAAAGGLAQEQLRAAMNDANDPEIQHTATLAFQKLRQPQPHSADI